MIESGYSGTPLYKKLGLKEGMKVWLIDPSPEYSDWMKDQVDHLKIYWSQPPEFMDFIHWFCQDAKQLTSQFAVVKARLERDGMLWVSWPKTGSKLKSNLKRDIIREFVLSGGLVDVKVCSIDENWSALKFVYRLKDRQVVGSLLGNA